MRAHSDGKHELEGGIYGLNWVENLDTVMTQMSWCLEYLKIWIEGCSAESMRVLDRIRKIESGRVGASTNQRQWPNLKGRSWTLGARYPVFGELSINFEARLSEHTVSWHGLGNPRCCGCVWARATRAEASELNASRASKICSTPELCTKSEQTSTDTECRGRELAAFWWAFDTLVAWTVAERALEHDTEAEQKLSELLAEASEVESHDGRPS